MAQSLGLVVVNEMLCPALPYPAPCTPVATSTGLVWSTPVRDVENPIKPGKDPPSAPFNVTLIVCAPTAGPLEIPKFHGIGLIYAVSLPVNPGKCHPVIGDA